MKALLFAAFSLVILQFHPQAYADCLSGDCVNGTGKYSYSDGGIYEGTFKDGFRDGQGTYVWPGKGHYEGSWTRGNQSGEGKYFREDGALDYSGQWQNGQHLVAAAQSQGEQVVQHQVANGSPCQSGDCINGIGRYNFEGFGIYEGRFSGGLRNGEGTFTWSDGTTYKGMWVNDKISGYGTISYPDKRRFEGIWQDNMKLAGNFEWPDGSKYNGQFQNDRIAGYGINSYADGSYYVGNFGDEKKNGMGTYFKSDGTILYSGNWKDDQHG